MTRRVLAAYASRMGSNKEIDQADEFWQTGWSVLAVGELSEISPESLRMLTPEQTPDPWAEGPRSVFLHLAIRELTRRRVHPA